MDEPSRAAPGHDSTLLTPERCKLYAATAMLAFIGLLGGLLAGLQDGRDQAGLPFGMDFASFWAASRLLWSGMASDVYIQAAHKLAELPVIPATEYEAFYYPPPYLLVCAPLAALGFFGALSGFMLATGACLAAALSLANRSGWVIGTALAFPTVMLNLIAGQNAMLTAAIMGGGLTLMDRRPRTAGAILGLMVIKPHLALAVPIALVLSGRWRVLFCAGLSAITLMGVSTVVFGTAIWPGFLQAAAAGRTTLEAGLVPFYRFQSIFAVTRMLGGGVGTAYLLQAVSAAAAIAALIRVTRRPVPPATERTVIVLASLLITPFVLDYDYTVLVFPLVWLLTAWTGSRFPTRGRLMLAMQYVLPISVFVYPPAHLCWLGVIVMLAWLNRAEILYHG